MNIYLQTNVLTKKDEIDMSVNEYDVRILIRTSKSTSRIINQQYKIERARRKIKYNC